jgi:hypothetical protein
LGFFGLFLLLFCFCPVLGIKIKAWHMLRQSLYHWATPAPLRDIISYHINIYILFTAVIEAQSLTSREHLQTCLYFSLYSTARRWKPCNETFILLMMPQRDHFSNDSGKMSHKEREREDLWNQGDLSSHWCPSKAVVLHQLSLIIMLFWEKRTVRGIKFCIEFEVNIIFISPLKKVIIKIFRNV